MSARSRGKSAPSGVQGSTPGTVISIALTRYPWTIEVTHQNVNHSPRFNGCDQPGCFVRDAA
jgi:hypothetical protein